MQRCCFPDTTLKLHCTLSKCVYICVAKKQDYKLITAAVLEFACISTWRCEPARLMAQWVNETVEDKAAFMAYARSRLHTYSLRGSFHLLISPSGDFSSPNPSWHLPQQAGGEWEGSLCGWSKYLWASLKLGLPISRSFWLRYRFQRDSGGNA